MNATSEKPSEQRAGQRRKEKQEGRGRRAALLLDKQIAAKQRQEIVDERVGQLEARVTELERRNTALETRVAQLEQAQNPS